MDQRKLTSEKGKKEKLGYSDYILKIQPEAAGIGLGGAALAHFFGFLRSLETRAREMKGRFARKVVSLGERGEITD